MNSPRLLHISWLRPLSMLLTAAFLFSALAAHAIGSAEQCAAVTEGNPAAVVVDDSTTIFDPIFKQMADAKDHPLAHPDMIVMVEFPNLTGRTVYVDTKRLRNPNLHTDDYRATRFEVRSAGRDENGKYFMVLYNREIGEFHLADKEVGDLVGNVYTREDFRERSRFVPGQFVNLGYPGLGGQLEPVTLYRTDGAAFSVLAKEAMPSIVKFVRVANDDYYEIEFANRWGEKSLHLLAPKADIWNARIGTHEMFERVLAPLQSLKPKLDVGERARYRDTQGNMTYGTVTRVTSEQVELSTPNGHLNMAPKDVYKSWGPSRPASIAVNTDAYWLDGTTPIQMDGPGGLVREYLDAAAHLANHPAFTSLNHVQRIKLLLRLESQVLPWRTEGATFETNGTTDLSDVLCAGVGVCRHNTPLMAAVLTEAGFAVRIQYARQSMEIVQRLQLLGSGHTWLEVDIPRPDGTLVTFAVDPSDGDIEPMSLAQLKTQLNADSPEALWYTNPNRQVLPLLKLKSNAN